MTAFMSAGSQLTTTHHRKCFISVNNDFNFCLFIIKSYCTIFQDSGTQFLRTTYIVLLGAWQLVDTINRKCLKKTPFMFNKQNKSTHVHLEIKVNTNKLCSFGWIIGWNLCFWLCTYPHLYYSSTQQPTPDQDKQIYRPEMPKCAQFHL